MRSLLARFLPVCALACGCRFALADDLDKLAKIEELLQLTHIEQIHAQIVQQIAARPVPQIPTAGTVPEARAAAEELQRKLLALITKAMRWEKVKSDYVKAYSVKFSKEEIDGMPAFYKSPVGRSMVEKMPSVLSEVRTQLANRVSGDGEIGQEVQRLIGEASDKSKPAQP
jgi:hypothetical protein